jgi:hypothetical protein
MQPLQIGDFVEVVDEKSPSYKSRGVIESVWGMLYVDMGGRATFFAPEQLRRVNNEPV